MPSLDTYKRQLSALGSTVGQNLKQHSDIAMEMTWDNDIQSKICYIYDYAHDDQPDLEYGFEYHMTTTKHRIDAKFIVTQYSTLSKDQVEYHLLFRPSEKVFFNDHDDLCWFETDYRKKFNMQYPIGLYVDIPDEKGIYRRWLICAKEIGNQFEKYSILPCDYRFQWVDVVNGKKVKYQMWGCTRSMNSYTAGLWIDRYAYSLDDVASIWIPLNGITQNFWYVNSIGENQRVCVSAKVDRPLTYKISKVADAKPVGIIKITLDQDNFNQFTDYIERDEDGYIIGMWADYYNDNIGAKEDTDEIEPLPICTVSAMNQNLRVGGSYKTITATLTKDNEDITDKYTITKDNWTVFIGDEDYTASELVTLLEQPDTSTIKVKFAKDRSYINKTITVRCTVDKSVGEIQLKLIG